MTPERFMKLYKRFGSIKAIGRHLDPENPMTGYHKARKGYLNARNAGLIDPIRMGAKGRDNATVTDLSRVQALETVAAPLPQKGKVTRYLFTSAQNDTPVFGAFWDNLQVLTAHYEAQLHISRFTYIKAGLGARGDKSQFVTRKDVGIGKDGLQWDPKIAPFTSDYRLEIAPDLLWCGEMNMLPTAERPLTGLEVYSGIKSAIFPHVKFAMDSIPSGKDEPTKMIYTTGTVTKRNYIHRKAGFKAEFHHCFHPDTEFLTREGLRSFRQLCNQSTVVWTGERWAVAEIKSFGVQQLYDIEFTPVMSQTDMTGNNFWRKQNTKLRTTFKATADHTWHLLNGETTNNLNVGDRVLGSTVTVPDESSTDYFEGIRHGLIFGDGSVVYQSVKNGTFSHQVCIHGDDARRWIHLFDSVTMWASRTHISNYHGTAYYKSVDNMKELPKDGSSPEYIRGFIKGWLSADGYKPKNGSQQLCSVTRYALDWLQRIAPLAGYTVTGLCRGGGDFTAFGQLREPLWRLTLTEKKVHWEVASISPAETTEVMCAVVDDLSHRFTLAGGIMTGNCYGALLVEVDANGVWFARQINADSDGTICDLRIMVKDGVLTEDNDVEAITWGDVHVAQIEPWVQSVSWGPYGMLEYLHPKYQFFHDVLDFRAKSHHEVKKPHKLFKRWLEGDTDVRKEAERTVKFMESAYRPWSLNVVVDSNHHHHLGRWLEEQNGTMDAKNAQFWTTMQAAVWQSLAAGAQHVNYFKLMVDNVRNPGSNADAFKILNQDESFVICRDKSGGIECGIHGHAGPDGTRGNPRAYARLGRKANIGHSHRAGIIDGIYSAGTCGRLDADWTEGPSSWSHSHIITYVTGKRAIVTMRNKKWRA